MSWQPNKPNNPNRPKTDQHESISRGIGFIAAVGGIIISIEFSAQGLAFETRGKYAVLGYFLAFFVTALQIALNRKSTHASYALVLSGIGAYLYSISTNIMGMIALRGYDNLRAAWTVEPELVIIAFAFGLAIDVAPEPLLFWSITGIADGQDIVGHLVKLLPTRKEKHDAEQQSQRGQKHQEQGQRRQEPYSPSPTRQRQSPVYSPKFAQPAGVGDD